MPDLGVVCIQGVGAALRMITGLAVSAFPCTLGGLVHQGPVYPTDKGAVMKAVPAGPAGGLLLGPGEWCRRAAHAAWTPGPHLWGRRLLPGDWWGPVSADEGQGWA